MTHQPHNPTAAPGPIVFTHKARCRDCYRCVRVCPVKAIRMEDGQAYVVEERCIACGTCVRECPQQAKGYRQDVETAMDLLGSARPVAVSIAPSLVAALDAWQRRRLPSALRRLGFAHVAETAVGAFPVAQRTAELAAAAPDRPHVCSSCPAVVSYIEKYRPELVDALLPVVSPMLAHASHIKAKLGPRSAVVFVGPCVAKKAEAQRPDVAGRVDCVLTFAELLEWLDRAGVELAGCEESDFDELPAGDGRLFPVAGGALRTARLSTDLLALEVSAVSGFEDIRDALNELAGGDGGGLLEPLFCRQGCINGPAMPEDKGVFARRKDVLDLAAERPGMPPPTPAGEDFALDARYRPCPIEPPGRFTEEQIRAVLEMTGKARQEDQLNCGACGYVNCRDKALAVLVGLAEPEMCIPFMRRLAEQRTDRIIETSPNGIVVLDERLNILSMNPAFRRMFMCSDAVAGKRISYLMDPDGFETLAAGQVPRVERNVRHEKYNLVCHEILYALPEERQFVGIFVNVTSNVTSQTQLDQLRAQTVLQARELLEHQVQLAQQLAQFLGENTARGEQLVQNLLRLAGEDEKSPKDKGRWLWDIYTSK